MCFTNKNYIFIVCLVISISVTCCSSLSHGKPHAKLQVRPSRVNRDVTTVASNSTDGNEIETDETTKEIRGELGSSPKPDVMLAPTRVHIKPTMTVTATRIGMSRYFSTSLPSPLNDGNAEALSLPVIVPVTPTASPQISHEKGPERHEAAAAENARLLLPSAPENASIITPLTVTNTIPPEASLIMQKSNSSSEENETKEDEEDSSSTGGLTTTATTAAATTTAAGREGTEQEEEKQTTEENSSGWDLLDPTNAIEENEVPEKLPAPIPLISPTDDMGFEDSQLEEDLAEVFNNDRMRPLKRRRFRNNGTGRRVKKMRARRFNLTATPYDGDEPLSPSAPIRNNIVSRNPRPNSFNQGAYRPTGPAANKPVVRVGPGAPRMTRRFRSTTSTTTTDPNELMDSQGPYVTEFAITEVPPPSFSTSGDSLLPPPPQQHHHHQQPGGPITPVLLTSPIISSFNRDSSSSSSSSGGPTGDDDERFNPEPQIERPTSVSTTDKTREYPPMKESTRAPVSSAQPGRRRGAPQQQIPAQPAPAPVASKKQGTAASSNETGEWLQSENSKRHDMPLPNNEVDYDDRNDWENNYMKLQQNSFYSPSAEEHEEELEETPIITIDDVRAAQAANISSSSRQGLINNSPETDHDEPVVIEHHHHHDMPITREDLYGNDRQGGGGNENGGGGFPGPDMSGPGGPGGVPSIFEDRPPSSSPHQSSAGHGFYPQEQPDVPYHPNSPSSPPQSFNPYLGSPDAPNTVPDFMRGGPRQGSHFDRTQHKYLSHPSPSDMGFMDKPIFMSDPVSKSESQHHHEEPSYYNSETIPPLNSPVLTKSPQPPPSYSSSDYAPPKPMKYFVPPPGSAGYHGPPSSPFGGEMGHPNGISNGEGHSQLSGQDPGKYRSGGPGDQHKLGSLNQRKTPMEDHFKSMRNSIIFKPPSQSNFPTFESSIPAAQSFSHMSGGAGGEPGKIPSGSNNNGGGGPTFKDSGVIEIHHHHFPDGTESTFYPGSDQSLDANKYSPADFYPYPPSSAGGPKGTTTTTWPGSPPPLPPGANKFPIRSSKQLGSSGLPEPPSGPSQHLKNPLKSGDFSNSHASISSFHGSPRIPPPSPPLTLPMPGLVHIPTPPPDSYAMNEVTPNQHFPPHTHSMASYSDYEPANPPLPTGHALAQHFDHFVQNAGDFKSQSGEVQQQQQQHHHHHEKSNSEEEHIRERPKQSYRAGPNKPPPRNNRQPPNKQYNNNNNNKNNNNNNNRYPNSPSSSSGSGKHPHSDNYYQGEPSQHNPPVSSNYYGDGQDNRGPPDYRDHPEGPDFGYPPPPAYGPEVLDHPTEHPNFDDQFNGIKPAGDEEDDKPRYPHDKNKYGNPDSYHNEYRPDTDGNDGKTAGGGGGGGGGGSSSYNELLKHFKELKDKPEQGGGNQNDKGKGEETGTPYSETPYIIMFPTMYPTKGTTPPPRLALQAHHHHHHHLHAQQQQQQQQHPYHASSSPSGSIQTSATQHFTGNPEKLLGPGVKVVPVHPRHQIMKALATKQYLAKMEALRSREKRPPNTIFTPYGVLVPMGISSPSSLATQTAAPPKLTSLLTAHSHTLPSSAPPQQKEAAETKATTDEKALLSLLLSVSAKSNGGGGGGRNAGNPKQSKVNIQDGGMESALDILAEKLAARLSPLENVIRQPEKSYGYGAYGNEGSYSELQPVKTSPGDDGNKIKFVNGTTSQSGNGGSSSSSSGSSNNNGKSLFASMTPVKQSNFEKPHFDNGGKDLYKVSSSSSPPPSSHSMSPSSPSTYLKSLLKDRLVEMLQERYHEVAAENSLAPPSGIPGKNPHSTPTMAELHNALIQRKESPSTEQPSTSSLGAMSSPIKTGVQAPFTQQSSSSSSGSNNPGAGSNNGKGNSQQQQHPQHPQQQQNHRPSHHPHQGGGILGAIKKLFSFGGANRHGHEHIKMNSRNKHGNGTTTGLPDRMKNRGDFPPRKPMKKNHSPFSGLPKQTKHQHEMKNSVHKDKPLYAAYGFKSSAEMEKMLRYLLKNKQQHPADTTHEMQSSEKPAPGHFSLSSQSSSSSSSSSASSSSSSSSSSSLDSSKAGTQQQQQQPHPGSIGFLATTASHLDDSIPAQSTSTTTATKWFPLPHHAFTLVDEMSTSASEHKPVAIKVIPAPQLVVPATSKYHPLIGAMHTGVGAATTTTTVKRQDSNFTPSPLLYPANILPLPNSWKPMPDSVSFINSLMTPADSSSATSTPAAPPQAYLTQLYTTAYSPSLHSHYHKKSISAETHTGHKIQPRSVA